MCGSVKGPERTAIRTEVSPPTWTLVKRLAGFIIGPACNPAMQPSLLPRTLHHPRSRTAQVLRPRLSGSRHARPLHPAPPTGQPRRRFLVEGLVAGLATVLMTGVALASPALLRQDPLTSLRDLAATVVPALGQPSSPGLYECP
jgi:hypothetical protein